MAFKLVWTPLARQDLREIVSYIARDNEAAARRVGERILSSVEVLASDPHLGRPVPERNDNSVREIVRGNYRIVYKVVASPPTIQLWRVWHGARGEPDLNAMEK